MDHLIARFCDWLAATQPSLLIQTVAWIIPLVQSVHIMAITVVVGSVLMVNMKLLGVNGRGAAVSAVTTRFLPWVWVALVVLLTTGVILITAEPRRDLLNNVFRLKMLLLVIVGAATWWFQTSVAQNPATWGERPDHPWRARLIGVATLAVWVGVIICGRWIAYVDHG
jgi:hypothetical protein